MSDFIGSRDTDTHRVCGSCGQLRLNNMFYRDGLDSKGRTRYRRDCKVCYKRTRLQEDSFKKQREKKRGKRYVK